MFVSMNEVKYLSPTVEGVDLCRSNHCVHGMDRELVRCLKVCCVQDTFAGQLKWA